VHKINYKLHKTEKEKLKLQSQLDKALTKLLSGFVSICCVCKKVRTQDKKLKRENWFAVEHYIMQRTDLRFSHGYCPECALKADELLEEEIKKMNK
jgi:hypothetical protein